MHPNSKSYFPGVYITLLMCIPVFWIGLVEGHSFNTRGASEICTAQPLARPAMKDGLFPLSNRCMWLNGTSTELVPLWVNVVLIVLLGLALVLLVLGIQAAFRRRSGAEQSGVKK